MFGLFIFVPLCITLPCVIGLIILWVAVLRNTVRGGSACGKCGYTVEGLTTWNCPECGSDLRQAGISTPASRRRIGPVLFLLLWTVLLPLPAVLAAGFAIAYGPTTTRGFPGSVNFNLPQTTSMPIPSNPNTLPSVSLSYYVGHGYDFFGSDYHSVRLQAYDPAGQSADLSVNLDNMTVDFFAAPNTVPGIFPGLPPQPTSPTLAATATSPATAPAIAPATASPTIAFGTPFGISSIEQLLIAAGHPPGHPDTNAAAADLLQAVQTVSASRDIRTVQPGFLIASAPQQWGPATSPAGWFIVLNLVGWPLLWITGILVYFAVQRRRNAPPPDAQPPRVAADHTLV